MNRDPVTITLTKSEALVLFELLSEFKDQLGLEIRHNGERVALWNLCGYFEKALAEPFLPQYEELHEEALEEVARGFDG